MATVINLATLEEKLYTCPAHEAVVCAFEQERKNWNAWQYDYRKAQFSSTGRTVSCGNWVAKVKED